MIPPPWWVTVLTAPLWVPFFARDLWRFHVQWTRMRRTGVDPCATECYDAIEGEEKPEPLPTEGDEEIES